MFNRPEPDIPPVVLQDAAAAAAVDADAADAVAAMPAVNDGDGDGDGDGDVGDAPDAPAAAAAAAAALPPAAAAAGTANADGKGANLPLKRSWFSLRILGVLVYAWIQLHVSIMAIAIFPVILGRLAVGLVTTAQIGEVYTFAVGMVRASIFKKSRTLLGRYVWRCGDWNGTRVALARPAPPFPTHTHRAQSLSSGCMV